MSATAPSPASICSAQNPHPEHLVGRRIAAGFGLVATVAAIMCAMLFSVIGRVSELVMEMRGAEHAIDDSHALATAVREQYTHQAHMIIEASRSHLGHYQAWVAKVLQTAQALRPVVPANERARLELVVGKSQQLDAIFREQIMPAVERGDLGTVARLHHDADRLSSDAAREADAIAQAVETRMVDAHVSATRATRLGLLGGGL